MYERISMKFAPYKLWLFRNNLHLREINLIISRAADQAVNTSTLTIKSHNINSLCVRHNLEPLKHIETSMSKLSSKICWLVYSLLLRPQPLICNILWRHKTSIMSGCENTQKNHCLSSILIINRIEQFWFFFRHHKHFNINKDKSAAKQLILEILRWFCSKGWDIKHRFS